MLGCRYTEVNWGFGGGLIFFEAVASVREWKSYICRSQMDGLEF